MTKLNGGFKTSLVIVGLVATGLTVYFTGIIETRDLISASKIEASEKYTPKVVTEKIKESVDKINERVQDIREEQIEQRIILNYIKENIK